MTTTLRKIKVGLIVDEYFGALGTAYGGYGMLTRHYIAKYLPNDEIEVEVLFKRQEGKYRHPFAKKHNVDGIIIYEPPSGYWCRRWLDRQDYDVYLSVEMTHDLLKYEKLRRKRRLIHWIQDPRPWKEWQEINTVKLFRENCYWNSSLYDLVHLWSHNQRVRFISQGRFLNDFAIDLYRLNLDTEIQYVPNPVEIDDAFDLDNHPKKKQIIFLGRIESVKRGWLFCEIAKQMPEYDFYIIGQTFREKSMNETIMTPYQTSPNLHFTGHLEGDEKVRFLKDAKILVNTSIHEALPITFLEALSYGTLLVSCRNPENLTSKFGVYVGKVLGDGFDKVDLFVDGIRKIISNEEQRKETARNAIAYIKENHSIKRFQNTMRAIVKDEAQKHRETH